MKLIKRAVLLIVVAANAACLVIGPVAFAHVVVQPAEVETAKYQVFTVSVPNEKTISTTEIKLEIPAELTNVTPTMKPGWDIKKDTDGKGEAQRVTTITWNGGEITEGLRDEFTFSAKTPDAAGELRWNAYQTYQDGSTVAWDQDDASSGHGHGKSASSGPFSVTVVSAADKKGDSHAHEHGEVSPSSNDWATYLSAAALLVSFGALFAALRQK